jgi:hypothetical protein
MARPALYASRSISVLNFLAANAPEQFTLSDISGRLDINLASAHALLNTMEEAAMSSATLGCAATVSAPRWWPWEALPCNVIQLSHAGTTRRSDSARNLN